MDAERRPGTAGEVRRVAVKVTAEFGADGRVRPLSLTWEDGRVFEVERVTDARGVASLKGGGAGMRYTCRIRNRVVYLFYEEPRWFLEQKGS